MHRELWGFEPEMMLTLVVGLYQKVYGYCFHQLGTPGREDELVGHLDSNRSMLGQTCSEVLSGSIRLPDFLHEHMFHHGFYQVLSKKGWTPQNSCSFQPCLAECAAGRCHHSATGAGHQVQAAGNQGSGLRGPESGSWLKGAGGEAMEIDGSIGGNGNGGVFVMSYN